MTIARRLVVSGLVTSLASVHLFCPAFVAAQELSTSSKPESAGIFDPSAIALAVKRFQQLPSEGQVPGGMPKPALARESSSLLAAQSVARISSAKAGRKTFWLLYAGIAAAGVGIPLYVMSKKGIGCGPEYDAAPCDQWARGGASMIAAGAPLIVAGLASKPGKGGLRAVGRTSQPAAITEITNNTPHMLTVVLEGPVVRNVSLAAGQKQVVELQAGQYTQTVQAANGEAESYRALQTYEASTRYREGFWIRK